MTCIEAEYKIEFDIHLDEEVCFPDGHSIILKDVQHLLCPCEVLCDAEGDLLIVLETLTLIDDNVIVAEKDFFTRGVFKDSDIFSGHEITDFSYTYGNEDEEVPACAADFEPEKMNLTFIITEKQ